MVLCHYLRRGRGKIAAGTIAPAMVATQGNELETIQRHCIRQGFWTMPITGLRQVAKYVGCPVEKTDDLPTIILNIARSEFGADFTDEMALEILRARYGKDEEELEMVRAKEKKKKKKDKGRARV